jgi:hypothetical protein
MKPCLLAVLICLMASGRLAQGAECLRYEPELVTLAGALKLKVFPGPPNYSSFESGDQPETVWMLTLADPICINAIPGDAWSVGQAGVKTIQVVPRAPFSLALNGKAVVVEGTLYRFRGGHPHAAIALRATHVAPSQP